MSIIVDIIEVTGWGGAVFCISQEMAVKIICEMTYSVSSGTTQLVD